MSRADPKHGRWILPLVIAGLVGFTYIFVNALPQAAVDGGTTTTIDAEGTVTTTTEAATTTTTLAPSINAFVAEVGDARPAAAELVTEARSLNDRWDAREIEFGDTRDGLIDLGQRTQQFAADLGVITVPDAAADAWAEVATAAEAMVTAADAMVDGLVNQEGSEGRLSALADYEAAGEALDAALVAARDAATA